LEGGKNNNKGKERGLLITHNKRGATEAWVKKNWDNVDHDD